MATDYRALAATLDQDLLREVASGNIGRCRLIADAGLSEWHARKLIDKIQSGEISVGGGASVEAETTPESEVDANQYLSDERVWHNDRTDVYVFHLRSAHLPVVIPGEDLKAMKRAYSNWDGAPASINALCRSFEIPRNHFVEIKTLMGWTHDSDPFLDEEILERDPEEMVEEVLTRRRAKLYRKAENRRYAETEKAAQSWWDLERRLIRPLDELIEKHARTYEPPRVNINTGPGQAALVLAPYDLHFGKYAWEDETGQSYSRAEAEELLFEKTNDVIGRAARHGVERVICPLGSDWFHIDNDAGETSSGTRQDTDGTPAQILMEGSDLAVKLIDILRQVAPVEIRYVSGNHDRLMSLSVLMYVLAWFRQSPDIEIHRSAREISYTTYGSTIMGFTHGGLSKTNKKMLGNRMLSDPEARAHLAGTRHSVFFVGHLHHEVVEDMQGVQIYQLPSLSSADRWHVRSGYTGARRAMAGYIVDWQKGVTVNMLAPLGVV